jgi:hypothetical protein
MGQAHGRRVSRGYRRGWAAASIRGVTEYRVVAIDLGRPPTLHLSPEAEARIPATAAGRPLAKESFRATEWGSPRLNRGLRQLGLRPRDVTIASGLSTDDGYVAIYLYLLRGVAAPDALRVLRPSVAPSSRTPFTERNVGGRLLSVADFDPHTEIAIYARDGELWHLIVPPALTDAIVESLK